jgi:hypothetical protein
MHLEENPFLFRHKDAVSFKEKFMPNSSGALHKMCTSFSSTAFAETTFHFDKYLFTLETCTETNTWSSCKVPIIITVQL